MPKKRLLNCDFINASAFKGLKNESKLLYLYMFANADDRGFCDNSADLITILNLPADTPKELIKKGLVFEFSDTYSNKIYLIRHWYRHNNWIERAYTNYYKFYLSTKLVDGEYVKEREKTIIKESKLNEMKLNEMKLNENITEKEEEKEKELTAEELEAEMPF